MCDEETEADNDRFLKLSRREIGVGAGAVVASLVAGCGGSTTPPTTAGASASAAKADAPKPDAPTPEVSDAAAGTSHRMVSIETPDGTAEAFFVAPSSGRHPGVVLWPDVAGLREAFNTMATRLAESGYAVLAVNPYYRSSKMPVLTTFSDWRTPEGKAKIAPMREALTAEGITRDGAAFVAWLDQQAEVDTDRKVGTCGYCMGGPFTFRTAAATERVGALASFHGGGLVSDAPDSPHTLLPKMTAAALVCVAQNDDERQPEAKETLREAAKSAGRNAEVEVYPAPHGWTVIDSPVYDEAQAERAWTRMLATFEAQL